MKRVFFFVALILGALLVVGSSGNFNSYNSTRMTTVEVVPHDKEYIGFVCDEGYIPVVVEANSEMDFDALTITNYLPENKDVDVALYPDYSGLPAGLDVSVETETGVPVTLAPGEGYTFRGHVNAGDVGPGEYVIPLDIYATWEGGGASISACPIRLIVVNTLSIQKTLLSGNTSGIPLETYQEWVFQIVVTNPTDGDLELTITDTIPAEFNVSLAGTSASAGTYTFWPASTRICHGCGGHQTQPATKMEWNVTVPAGGSEHINVTIFTRTNGGNHQEFTSCGEHTLNEGAEIKGYGIVSKGLWVSVVCNNDQGNCCSGSCRNQCNGNGG